MVELIKSTVKCYKKKTKKMVGGKRKTYEYNQYQVPLRKSDNLTCSDEVFIILQNQFEDLIQAELDAHLGNLDDNQAAVQGYEKELAELEWKHGELSRSYKTLVSKNAQTNKRLRLEGEKVTGLEEENQKLLDQLQRISNQYQILMDKHNEVLKKNELIEEEASLKKDQDLWTALRSRLSKKDEEERN